MKKFFVLILMLLVAFNCNAYGYAFPDGSVQGLPQNLIVMDENGHSPDYGNGELFISIDNMIPYEVYEKDITIMNARNDAVYAIYMTATPNFNYGDIDLLGETVCKLWLDDELIYTGLVNGDGTPNIQEDALDLGGVLKKGESRNLHAEFVWQAGLNEENDTDNSYYGIVSFHWTFFASIPKDTTPSGGGGGGGEHNPPQEDVVNKPGVTVNDGDKPPHIPYPDIDPNDYPQNNPQDIPGDSVDENEGGQENPTPTPNIPPEDISNPGDEPSIIEEIIKNTPIIPEDVKTGYMSQLVFYTKVAIVAFGFALIIIILIVYNSIRLRRLKRNSQNIVRG